MVAAFTRLRNLTLNVPRHSRLAGQGAILEPESIRFSVRKADVAVDPEKLSAARSHF